MWRWRVKAQKGSSLSARCVGVCPFRRTYASVRNTNHEVGAAILKKRGRKWTKQDEIRRKVHLFLWNEIEFPLFATFYFRKSRNFETKILLLCLIKHNIPFSTAWRRLYSANWGTFFQWVSADDLWLAEKNDTLQWEVSRLVLEGFVFSSPPVYRKKKGVFFPNRPIWLEGYHST